jgi:hypothetical protein
MLLSVRAAVFMPRRAVETDAWRAGSGRQVKRSGVGGDHQSGASDQFGQFQKAGVGRLDGVPAGFSDNHVGPLGRLLPLARTRELDNTHPDRDLVKLGFRTLEDLHRGDLVEFLTEHRDATRLQAVADEG